MTDKMLDEYLTDAARYGWEPTFAGARAYKMWRKVSADHAA